MADIDGSPEDEDVYGSKIEILGTNLKHPENGRIFVWTEIGWFERLEGPSGNVAFTHVADSEEELRRLISLNNPQADLYEPSLKYKNEVSEEFMEQLVSSSDSPEDPGEEVDEDDQEYHQHDL